MNKISSAAKSSIAFMLVSFFSQGVSFIITPIITRILTKEEYGQVSLFCSWYDILGVFAMLCLSFGIFNNGMMDHKEDKDVFTNSMLALSNVATALVGVVFVIAYYFFPEIISFDKKIIVILFLIFIFQPAYNFWLTRNRFEFKYKAVSAVCLITTLLSATLSIVFIKSFDSDKAYLKILGQYLPLLICYLIIYFMIVYKAKGKVKLSYWKYALAFNLPLIPHYLSIYILNGADRLMIDGFCGEDDVAIYSLAYTVASVVNLVWQSINASLVPYTYERCKNEEYKAIDKIGKSLLLLYGGACVLLLLVLPEIFMILAPASYQDGIFVAIPVVGGTFLIANYFLFANVVYYYKKPKFVMIASVTAAVLNVILNFLLIPKIGYIAAGYTTIISYVVQALIDYFAMKHVVGDKEIYNMKHILLIDVGIIAVIMSMNVLYQSDILRWIMIVVMVIIAFVNRKKLLSYARLSANTER